MQLLFLFILVSNIFKQIYCTWTNTDLNDNLPEQAVTEDEKKRMLQIYQTDLSLSCKFYIWPIVHIRICSDHIICLIRIMYLYWIRHHYEAIHTPPHWSAETVCITFRPGLVLTSCSEETHDRPLRFYYCRTAVQISWRSAGLRWGTCLKTTSTTSRPRFYWPQCSKSLMGFRDRKKNCQSVCMKYIQYAWNLCIDGT